MRGRKAGLTIALALTLASSLAGTAQASLLTPFELTAQAILVLPERTAYHGADEGSGKIELCQVQDANAGRGFCHLQYTKTTLECTPRSTPGALMASIMVLPIPQPKPVPPPPRLPGPKLHAKPTPGPKHKKKTGHAQARCKGKKKVEIIRERMTGFLDGFIWRPRYRLLSIDTVVEE